MALIARNNARSSADICSCGCTGDGASISSTCTGVGASISDTGEGVVASISDGSSMMGLDSSNAVVFS